MIISHKHKFIFVKTVKTAGTSLELFLSQHCGPDDLLTPFDSPIERHQPRNYEGSANPTFEILRLPFGPRSAWKCLRADRRRFYNHMPAWVVRLRVPPAVWNSYFKFCVERNPWDKVLSHYHMHAYRVGGALSLEQYFARGKFPINYPRYTDPSGSRIIVDRVLRYENLTEELGEIFARLKLPFGGDLGVRKKGHFRTDRTPYQSVFSPEQRQTVERIFAREIQLHGYRFEQNPQVESKSGARLGQRF
jgi:hypothetical protein